MLSATRADPTGGTGCLALRTTFGSTAFSTLPGAGSQVSSATKSPLTAHSTGTRCH
eukprot:CAMPEP_0172640044 /NCGR_PEP_ID=MMETSP1068-20121228/221232_1 /TAXON_ID=35684 /ORGANISM="Pseudopedinella elastica, Strain CCMP716" /LENGTH=55 /DNA_ID=CAMNT_0013453333 /DNA_START=94 /DNA_END=258 /DNA_ORIENTATION=+